MEGEIEASPQEIQNMITTLGRNIDPAELRLTLAQKIRDVCLKLEANVLFYQKKTKVDDRTPEILAMNSAAEIMQTIAPYLPSIPGGKADGN